MKQLTFLLLTFCFLGACDDATDSRRPSAEFENFAAYLDTLGYSSEPARTQQISPRQVENAVVFTSGKRTFYLLDPAGHQMLQSHTKKYVQPADYDLFSKAQFIAVYHYYSKEKSNMRADGVIEEWQFETGDDAEKALRELEKIKEMLYFNTKSFCFRSKSRLYVFHTRAAAFNGPLEEIYTAFQKRV